MEWPLADTAHATEEIFESTNPYLRLFTAPRYAAAEPMRENDGKWTNCTPETSPAFSAIGYHFGRLMHDALNVPIGVIDASWGESRILNWTPANCIKGRDELKEAARVLYEDPQAKSVPLEEYPSGLFNGMIAPFTRLPIRGILWYQGESDVPRTQLYRFAFRNLIQAWRQTWGRFDLPFLFAQIAGHGGEREVPGDDPWAEMREIQAEALQLPATGMAVAADTGDSRGINPRDERTVAERFALVALSVAYHFDVVCSGPVYEGFTIEGDSIRLHFSHADSGLLVRRADKLKGFAIAGNDRVFRWADARIDGRTVLVNHPAVRAPAAVRYAWESSPLLCLFNGSGLPAAPFRTDDWEPLTYRDVPGAPARRKQRV
jgi:sialate O-acetylesterase